MAFLQSLREWGRARETAEGLWFILQRERASTRGVGLPITYPPGQDPEGTRGKINARAVDILRAQHPELDVTIWKGELFVTFRDSLAALKTSDYEGTHDTLAASEGEDLVIRAETQQERAPQRPDPVDEVYERWPGAVEGRKLKDVGVEEMTSWKKDEEDRVEERERRDEAWEMMTGWKKDGVAQNGGTTSAPVLNGTPVQVTIYSTDGEALIGAGADGRGLAKLVSRTRGRAREIGEKLLRWYYTG